MSYIRHRSKRKEGQWREYVKKRNRYIEENPLCVIKSPHCTGITESVQHAKGRGIYLCEEKYWFPSCNFCNGWLATCAEGIVYGKEKGFILDRIGHE